MTLPETLLLNEIASIDGKPSGAFNIRINGTSADRFSTESIAITSKTDKQGIDVRIRKGTKGETVHIPVVISESGISEVVYNDFYIGDDCDVIIVAGCGIHNDGCNESKHDGVHSFYIGKNSRVKYIEKHYGSGNGDGKRVMNPVTEAFIGEGSLLEMDTVQIKGVDSTKRVTNLYLEAEAQTVISEKLMTHGDQYAVSDMTVELRGEGANGRIISRSVAKDTSKQVFNPRIVGKADCFGHVRCDSILMDDAVISSVPAIIAEHTNAQLVHEAAIGRIAGDQLLKLMTLGLTEEEAEEKIIEGFLA